MTFTPQQTVMAIEIKCLSYYYINIYIIYNIRKK